MGFSRHRLFDAYYDGASPGYQSSGPSPGQCGEIKKTPDAVFIKTCSDVLSLVVSPIFLMK